MDSFAFSDAGALSGLDVRRPLASIRVPSSYEPLDGELIKKKLRRKVEKSIFMSLLSKPPMA